MWVQWCTEIKSRRRGAAEVSISISSLKWRPVLFIFSEGSSPMINATQCCALKGSFYGGLKPKMSTWIARLYSLIRENLRTQSKHHRRWNSSHVSVMREFLLASQQLCLYSDNISSGRDSDTKCVSLTSQGLAPQSSNKNNAIYPESHKPCLQLQKIHQYMK